MSKLNVFIILSLWGVFASAQNSPHISVHQNSKIGSRAFVYLEDIADFLGFEPETLETLRKIEISESPKAGQKKHYTNIGFAQILRSKLSDVTDLRQIELSIPSEVNMSRKSSKLEAAEVEAELINGLKSQCSSCEYEVTSLVLPIINQDMSQATYKIKVQNVKGSFSIPIEVINEDETKKLFWLSGSLSVRRVVPVAKRNINSGDLLKDDDFTYEKKDVTYVNDNFASAEDLKSAVSARMILANQIIDTSSIRKPSIITAGDTVKVFIGDDGWQVSIDGVAQQNAYKGDAVKVKISRTQKLMSGIATAKGMVQVQ